MKSIISVYPFSIPGKFHPGTRQFFRQQVPSTHATREKYPTTWIVDQIRQVENWSF